MSIARGRMSALGIFAVVALAAPANAYKCDSSVFPPADPTDTTSCVPPMLQAVEANGFSFVFKLDDSDSLTSQPITITLYDATHTATNSPASCIQYIASMCTYYLHATDAACYNKISSSQFPGVTISPNTAYSYNVNVGGTCTHGSGGYTVSGGTWFNTRRNVTTPPLGATSGVTFAIIGDTRDGGQGDCGEKTDGGVATPGYALHAYGDIARNAACGGSNGQRNNYATTVAELSPKFIIHTGDIGSSDKITATMQYWNDIGSAWKDFSTTFMFGNHEFGSPNGAETGEQEAFGTAADTFVDAMVAVPATPISGGTVAYPAGYATFYAQNYANVHIAYLNSQLCGLDAFNGIHASGDACPNGNVPPSTSGVYYEQYETSADTSLMCGCWNYSKTQRDWLISDLVAANADPNIDFIIVGMHKPYWSNGADTWKENVDYGDSKTDEWTNTIGRLEYQVHESGTGTFPGDANNLSFPGGLQVSVPSALPSGGGAGFGDTGFKPFDAILQMYNVDLFVNSHAHYYEHLTDQRYRPSTDSGIPHLIIGGGGAAEQTYQCPGYGGTCTAQSSAYPIDHLPTGILFNAAKDGNFYVGDGSINNTSHTMQVYVDEIDEAGNLIGTIDSFAGAGIVSRKSQIRGSGAHSGTTDPFNGCNLVYSTSTGLAANGTYLPPPVSHNNHCVVN
jgi:hypothetical protein